MQNIISKINELNAALKEFLPLRTEYQTKLDKKFRLEFNYNSNHMEGNTLTYSETELLLIFDETKGNHTLREYQEMKSHDVALALIRDWAADDERPLTETQIKNLNETILVKPFWKDAITSDGQKTKRQIEIGNYKKFPNSVVLSNGEIFEYASVTDTPILMGELIQWYHKEEQKKESHPVILAAMLHYKLVRIHPFDDGNGRISRLLMNYVLLKNNLPPVVIKSADKRNYLSALKSADAGKLEDFVIYIGQQLIWSLDLSLKAANGQSIEEFDDLDKELYILKRELAGTNLLKTAASANVICDAIEVNIIPLFILIENKLEGLKEFFFDTSRRIDFEGDGEKGTVGSKDSVWEQLIDNWLQNRIRANGKKLKELSYNYELKGFKKTISADSLWLNVKIVFDEYNYTIRTNKTQNKADQFAYDKKLSNEELQDCINPMIKQVINNIKGLKYNR